MLSRAELELLGVIVTHAVNHRCGPSWRELVELSGQGGNGNTAFQVTRKLTNTLRDAGLVTIPSKKRGSRPWAGFIELTNLGQAIELVAQFRLGQLLPLQLTTGIRSRRSPLAGRVLPC